jgi:hypothetical protein
LDVGIFLLVLVATTANINNFNTGFVFVFEEDILGFEIAMYDVIFFEE